ncbi:SsgA family sporulation/cell division regulator [Streptomyces venezuelae]|uniref:SsgA family sporulation/cell division regulator n=1 Tax=Streptomyces venezuelae TaxID=54571 RepID=A0A5P2D086_STRVZ|nr:SsgA family sporulation/cell division regulator [Streptomyces venezuelae]QES48123.1 SsgA family sporulation/cell division regulator [Streptomyces venezuelae]
MATTEHCVIPLHLETGPDPIELRGVFGYRSDRPYEVSLDFHGAGMILARWVFARDLLLDGQIRATGQGDIRIWPAWRGVEPRVLLAFSNGHQDGVVSARAKDVRRLCRRMTTLVPRGAEGRYYDLDAELNTLLWR